MVWHSLAQPRRCGSSAISWREAGAEPHHARVGTDRAQARRMRKPHVSMSASVLLGLAFAAACSTTDSTAGSSDGGADAGGSACSLSSLPREGDPCSPPGLECPGQGAPCAFNPQCPVCATIKPICGDDGRWRIVSTTPSCPNLCPSVFPKAGEPCDTRGLECAEPARPCESPCECPRLVATCRNDVWNVVDTSTPPPACFADAGDASPTDGGSDADK